MAKSKAATTPSVERTGMVAWQSALQRFDNFLETVGHRSVFAEPVEAGGRTVIGAAEVAMGVGGGGGGSFKYGEQPDDAGTEVVEDGGGAADDFGGGGGGGGFARPVAVIIIDDDGVRVEPVVDATKIALAAITAFGSMVLLFARMWRGAGGK